MEIEKLKEIMKEFDKSAANSLKVKIEGLEIELEKGATAPVMMTSAQAPVIEQIQEMVIEQVKEETNYEQITSPLVGLYYASKDEESTPYVQVGQKVKVGDTLFLIEAMKVFNEIKSPVEGVVKTIKCQSGSAVEFEQVILEIDLNV